MDLRRFGGYDSLSSEEICNDVIKNYETSLARYCVIDIQLGQLVILKIYQLKNKKTLTSIKLFSNLQ